jgi:hypothetical protein
MCSVAVVATVFPLLWNVYFGPKLSWFHLLILRKILFNIFSNDSIYGCNTRYILLALASVKL